VHCGNARGLNRASYLRWVPSIFVASVPRFAGIAFPVQPVRRRDARRNEHAQGEKRHVRDTRSTDESDSQPDQNPCRGIIGDALEFFDYFLIGFVLAFLIGPWKLTSDNPPSC